MEMLLGRVSAVKVRKAKVETKLSYYKLLQLMDRTMYSCGDAGLYDAAQRGQADWNFFGCEKGKLQSE